MPPPPVPKKKHERGLVTVTVVAARNLRDCERFGNMDPYVTVRLDDSAHSTAVVAKGGTDCEFGDVLTYHVEERPTVLLVDAWDKERVGKDDHVGQGELPLSRGAKIVGETMTAWVPLLAKGLGPVWQGEPTDMEAGEVQLQVRFTKDGTPLVISGYLDKRSASWPSWDRHWCELRGTALVFFNEDASGVRRAAGEVSLLECSGVRSSAAPDAREAEWELVHEKRTFRLAAASDEEAISWMDACRSVIPGLAEAAAGDASPTRGDAMADGDATPRGRSAPREAALVRKYLAAMTGKPAKGQDMFEALKSGVLLCELANKCEPGVVQAFSTNPLNSIVEMENINLFLSAAAKLGVEPDLICQHSDLWDGITVGAERASVLGTLKRLSELYPAA